MAAIMKLWSIVTRDELRRQLINQAAEANRMRSALEDIYELAGWHCDDDDDADPNDASPRDAHAHTNGLIRKLCMSALAQKPAPRNVHHHPDLGEETKRALSNQENMIDD